MPHLIPFVDYEPARAYTLVCRRCQRTFEAARPHARSCSQACRTALYRTRLLADARVYRQEHP